MGVDFGGVDEQLHAGNITRAVALLRQIFEQQPTLPVARSLVERLNGVAWPGRQTCRLWWARSFTVEPLFPLLRAAAALEGLDVQQQAGDHNAYAQEILDPNSQLYRFEPNVVVLAVQTRDVLPEVWDWSLGSDPQALAQRVERVVEDLRNWLSLLRSRSSASVIVLDFAQPIRAADGVLDAQSTNGQAALLARLNQELRALAAATTGIHILGFDALVSRIGREQFFDERKWLTARMPIGAQHLWSVARECLGVLLPLTGKVRKAVVVDLDNTLWGGVVGEDGPAGLQLGIDYPGAAHLALQRVLLDLHRRGVILAIASKNNPADALEVLERHPGMLLRPRHFAAMRLNWDPKSQNLRAIAAELNIGTDSLVFVDDNPAERAEVGQHLPEVLVIDLPRDPMQYAAALRQVASLERLRVLDEDRDRGRQYAEQRARTELERSAGSLEEFYRSLQMQVLLAKVSATTLPRVSQLTQKTNQFNLTTHRYDEARVAAMMAAGDWHIYTCSVQDRFGDNGLVGVTIAQDQGAVWEIDSLLMSCRVIGRTVETAMLSHLMATSRSAGARTLRGWFLPTRKNGPAAGFYESHGFRLIDTRDGAGLWEFDLQAGHVEWPAWLEATAAETHSS